MGQKRSQHPLFASQRVACPALHQSVRAHHLVEPGLFAVPKLTHLYREPIMSSLNQHVSLRKVKQIDGGGVGEGELAG